MLSGECNARHLTHVIPPFTIPSSIPSQDLESTPGTISFSKNGSYFGTAFVLDEDVQGKVLYPHVATKNVVISLNFKMVRACH